MKVNVSQTQTTCSLAFVVQLDFAFIDHRDVIITLLPTCVTVHIHANTHCSALCVLNKALKSKEPPAP